MVQTIAMAGFAMVRSSWFDRLNFAEIALKSSDAHDGRQSHERYERYEHRNDVVSYVRTHVPPSRHDGSITRYLRYK